MKIARLINICPLAFECSLIFLSCILVYLANGSTIGTKDTIPNTILGFNWIFNHQINFDNFRGNYFYRQPIWYFIESFNGHLTSAYPIGTAIISLPFYLIFSAVLWLNGLMQDDLLNIGLSSIDITKAAFDLTRLSCEKLVATLITATAVVIFYLATNLKFNKSICLLITFTYAFATQTWMTSSQALWQHTAANLVISSILLCLLKANRAKDKWRYILLITIGILCGLIFSIRPTDIVFAIAAITYAIFAYRYESIFLLLGLPSILLGIGWNFYYFGGSILGGYSNQTGLFSFTLEQFIRSFLGLLFSPSRGLFIFTPVLLFAIPGTIRVFKLRAGRDEKLILCFTIASLVLFLNYCFFSVWWQGWTYGCRFLADALSVFCFLIGYPLNIYLQQIKNRKRFLNVGFILFLSLVLLSTSIQTVGAFSLNTGQANWDAIPAYIDTKSTVGMGRLWNWKDSPIERSTRIFLYKLAKKLAITIVDIKGLDGKIEQVHLYEKPSTGNVISAPPGSTVLVQADLNNIGTSDWLGYESGVEFGTVMVRARFYDSNRNLAKEGQLFVSSTPKGKHTQAIGYIGFPDNLGTYQLVFELVGHGNFVSRPENSYVLQAKADSEQQIFSQEFSLVQVPKAIPTGATVQLFTIVQNLGNFPWLSKVRDFDNKIKHPVNLAYRWINSQGEIEESEKIPLPWSVFNDINFFYNLCNQVGINAKVKAPTRPGNYILQLTMVHEGVAWFDEKGAKAKDIPITVTEAS